MVLAYSARCFSTFGKINASKLPASKGVSDRREAVISCGDSVCIGRKKKPVIFLCP